MDNRHFNKGNPNLKDEKKVGPQTKIGKLRNSLHPIKYKNKSALKINPESMAAKAVGYDKSKESLQAYHNFVSFVLEQPIKSLNEIERLEGLLAMMEISFSKVLTRLEAGESLSDKDRKEFFLMKDTLVELHKIKYGEKKVNVNIDGDLKDIRDMMFEE